jgi:hypothetical protein
MVALVKVSRTVLDPDGNVWMVGTCELQPDSIVGSRGEIVLRPKPPGNSVTPFPSTAETAVAQRYGMIDEFVLWRLFSALGEGTRMLARPRPRGSVGRQWVSNRPLFT